MEGNIYMPWIFFFFFKCQIFTWQSNTVAPWGALAWLSWSCTRSSASWLCPCATASLGVPGHCVTSKKKKLSWAGYPQLHNVTCSTDTHLNKLLPTLQHWLLLLIKKSFSFWNFSQVVGILKVCVPSHSFGTGASSEVTPGVCHCYLKSLLPGKLKQETNDSTSKTRVKFLITNWK